MKELWRNQINNTGRSRVWEAEVKLKTNGRRTLKNTSASSYEEAVSQFQMFTNFKEFIIEPHIIQ